MKRLSHGEVTLRRLEGNEIGSWLFRTGLTDWGFLDRYFYFIFSHQHRMELGILDSFHT